MLHRTRLHECLRLVATVPGHELDAVARLVRLGGRIIRGMYRWTLRQLHAVRSLVKHGHFAPMPASATIPVVAFGIVVGYTLDVAELCDTPFGIARADTTIVDDMRDSVPMPEWVNDCRTL